MGQLTLARFRGDTTFGLVARIMSTFLGGVVGMVMWYISAGSGLGNPYGLAAVCAVCYPVFFYGRLYWPGPPMTNAIFFVTAALVSYLIIFTTTIIEPVYRSWGILGKIRTSHSHSIIGDSISPGLVIYLIYANSRYSS